MRIQKTIHNDLSSQVPGQKKDRPTKFPLPPTFLIDVSTFYTYSPNRNSIYETHHSPPRNTKKIPSFQRRDRGVDNST